ncbi:MAG: hypothetical protein IJN04_06490 [Clostridia bacterium]|nr:hypothetical protein [Clostridia bacterium]
MTFWETMAWICVMLLALYGCTGAVRRLCLWLTRCPRCVECCRLAIPRGTAELEPLVRCLQSQAVWDEPTTCRYTLVVLPPEVDRTDEELKCIFRAAPWVIPVTCEELTAMVRQASSEK